MRTRFAPSPTGLMHFGNLRTALFNYLLALHDGGEFVLRIEDTDQARNKPEYVEHLKEDLYWLGLHWHEGPHFQSERQETYDFYYQKLEEADHAYPCFCSEQQLAMTRKAQLSAGQPPRYPGTCRNLTPEERQAKQALGISPTLRFHVKKNHLIEFVDLIKGRQKFKTNDIGDFIIRRADGTASFMFCNAIDDSEMCISHALRGEDHLTNTPRQLLLLETLEMPVPQYGHFPMIVGMDGSPLSKRNGSAAVKDLREQGFHPQALFNYLARLGHYYENNALLSLQDLAAEFSLKHINNSPAKHDVSHFGHWQKEALLATPTAALWEMIEPHVKNILPNDAHLDFTEVIKPNIQMPSEALHWAHCFYDETISMDEQAQDVLDGVPHVFWQIAIEAIQEQFDYDHLIKQLKMAGFKGKQLFKPLRIALTGQEQGPELARILELLGQNRVIERFGQRAPAPKQ